MTDRHITTTVFMGTPIAVWAKQYIDHLDTAITQEVCKCEWLCHPDDLDIRPLCCRDCKHPRDKHRSIGDNVIACVDECTCDMYMPRRVRMGDLNMECPAHSPVGRITGFFEYVFTQYSKGKTDDGI